MIQEDLPTPTELLQQFADSVIASMDARSVTGFENTLRDMREYHRLLLELYATSDDNGNVTSYAMLDEGWGPLHRAWLQTYRGVIGRAISKLDEDPQYFTTIAYVPYGLLATRDRLAPQLVRSILDLGSLVIYRLEEWFTRRAITSGAERSRDNGLTLIGSDGGLYETAIMSFVGTWESTARTTNTLDRTTDLDESDGSWEDLQKSWSGIVSHLENAAGFFVIAAWNQDVIGVQRFADLLLRWASNLRLSGSPHAYSRPWLVNGELMALDWAGAQAALEPLLHPHRWEALTPTMVFSQVVENLHTHVVLLTAAVTMKWSFSGKGGQFAVEAAGRLLKGVLVDPDAHDHRREAGRTSFAERLQQIIAVELAGERYEEATYGSLLDGIASSLDQISERRMTTGRTYTPSTIHDRHGLSRTLDLILLTATQPGAADAAIHLLQDIIGDGAALPGAPRALDDFTEIMSRLQRTLDTVDKDTQRTLLMLDESWNPTVALPEARAVVERSLEFTDALRMERYAKQPVAAQRLALLETGIHEKLIQPGGGIPFFQGVEIRTVADQTIPERQHIITEMPKSEFVDPPIEAWSSNFFDVHADFGADLLIRPLWAAFRERPSRKVTLRSAPDTVIFWRTIVRRAAEIENPVLLLSKLAYKAFRDRFLFSGRREEHPLVIKRRRDEGLLSFTVDGLDVYEASFSARSEAYLISANLLRTVEYRTLENGLTVVATFATGRKNPRKGKVTLRFAPRYLWSDTPIFLFEFQHRD
jgi:hypothetical protein